MLADLYFLCNCPINIAPGVFISRRLNGSDLSITAPYDFPRLRQHSASTASDKGKKNKKIPRWNVRKRMPAMHSLPPDIAAQNKGPAMMAVMYSFTALSSLTVVGRVFSRYKKLGHLAIDDYVIILSLVGSLFCSL